MSTSPIFVDVISSDLSACHNGIFGHPWWSIDISLNESSDDRAWEKTIGYSPFFCLISSQEIFNIDWFLIFLANCTGVNPKLPLPISMHFPVTLSRARGRKLPIALSTALFCTIARVCAQKKQTNQWFLSRGKSLSLVLCVSILQIICIDLSIISNN